jgi:hypothetical protein
MTASQGSEHVELGTELLQHARPHLDALRTQVEARPKPAPKKPDA